MPTAYRAENIGSLLRPEEVLVARSEYCSGKIDVTQLRTVEDQAIVAALDLQAAVGIDIFTDGEYRRDIFTADITAAVDGFIPTNRDATANWRGPHRDGALRVRQGDKQLVVGDKLRKKGRLVPGEAPFLKRYAPGPFKVCIPSVSYWTSKYQPGTSDTYYRDRSEMIRDLAEVLRDEVELLVSEGASYIQLDAPSYMIHLMDALGRQRLTQLGIDPNEVLDQTIAGDNAVVSGILGKEGVTIGMHLCRGNNRSAWAAEGSYEPIAEKIFGSLHVDTFLLEYDSDRSGGFEPLRFMPRNKKVVLGLITTKEPTLESEDVLRRRIDEAARYIDVDNLAISTQCGFASTAYGNLVSWDDQRRKLELVVKAARWVWGE